MQVAETTLTSVGIGELQGWIKQGPRVAAQCIIVSSHIRAQLATDDSAVKTYHGQIRIFLPPWTLDRPGALPQSQPVSNPDGSRRMGLLFCACSANLGAESYQGNVCST